MSRRGSVLVLTLALAMAAALLTRLAADLASASLRSSTVATAADFALLSAARVRAKSLETVAARWEVYGSSLSVAGADVVAPPGGLAAVAAAADALRRALPGYQGRVSAALTVALEANGVSRDDVTIVDDGALRLGLESQRAAVREPGGPYVLVDGLWFRRRWTGSAAPGASTVSVAWRAPRAGGAWEAASSAAATLRWDADVSDPAVRASGNGGFPADASGTIDAGAFRPNRYPLFRADLGRDAS